MFDYSILHWTTFLGATLLLTVSPGPDIAFILGQTARGGARAGFAAMFGIWTGTVGHIVMAALGLSAILATSAAAFSVVKWLGAAYLIWLGIQAIRQAGNSYSTTVSGPPNPRAVFRQGAIVALLNPKVAIFFLAFLPQFVVPGAGPAGAQLVLHGLMIIGVAAFIEPAMVIAGARLTGALKRRPSVGFWMDRALGALFVGLGIKLAMSER